MAGIGEEGLDASFGAARAVPTRIEVQQVKASVRERLFGIQADKPRLGEYRVSRRIGRGGMGAVYEAVDASGEVVALKTLRGYTPAMLYHLKNEFRALAGVTHPNLIGLDKLYVSGTQAYFTMELVDGRDLVRYVRGEPGAEVSMDEVVERLRGVLPQLVDAVAALHRAGKLHRDLKPSNVLVTATGRAVVLDFGLVRDMSEVSALSSSNEAFVGTPAYMAPELASGDSLSEDGDWYAIGVMLFEALVGRLPFDGGGFQVLLEKCQSASTPVQELVPEAPADLAMLCDRLLLRDPAERPKWEEIRECVGAPPKPEILQAPKTQMIGRGRQLQSLRRALADVVTHRRPGLACVRGDSGIGKSALLQQFIEEIQRSQGARVLAGRCYTSESVPFRALDPLIDALTRILVELLPEEAAALVPPESWALTQLFPVLGRVAAFAERGDGPTISDAAEVQRRAIGALRHLLGALAQTRPLILVIDDLQWSDEDSAVLLREILGAADAPPVLLAVGIRADRVASNTVLHTLDELGEALPVEHIELGALAADEARALLCSLSHVAADDERLDPLIREAAGVPLFLVELARHLESTSGAAKEVALDELIRARLAGLPQSAKKLLEILAIAGRPLAPAVVIRAAGLPPDRSLVPRLKAAHVVCERGSNGDAEIEIFHERIRSEVFSGISRVDLPALHRALALELARVGESPALLASHFFAGGLRPLALKYTLVAGEEAMKELAFRRAVGFFTSGLELAEVGPEMRGIHRRLAEALGYLGQGSEAAEHYVVAATGADPEEALPLRRAAAAALLRCGEIERGCAALRGVLREVDESWPGSGVKVSIALATERLRLRFRGQGFTLREAGSVEHEERERLETLCAARDGLSSCDPQLAMVFQARLLRRALAAGEPNYLVRALVGEAAFSANIADGRRKVDHLLETADELLPQCTDPRAQEAWELCAGVVAFNRGRWQECVQHIVAMRELGLRHPGSAYHSAIGGFFEGSSLFFLGDLRQLRARREVWSGEFDEACDLSGSTTVRVGMQVFALLAEDSWEAARAEVRSAVEHWPEGTFVIQRAWAFLAQRAIDLYAGDVENAWARLEDAWPAYCDGLGFSGAYIRIMGRFWRANVALARCAAGGAGADSVAAAELRLIERENAEWGEPFKCLLRAGLLVAKGDMEGAVAAYRQAALSFEASDMSLWAAAARLRLGELLGEDEGAVLVAAAAKVAQLQGIAAPARLFATLAPSMR